MVLPILMPEFVVCPLTSLLQLTGASPSASGFGDRCALSVEKRILASLSSRPSGQNEQYNMFEVLCDSGYDINLGSLAQNHYRDVDWSPGELS